MSQRKQHLQTFPHNRFCWEYWTSNLSDNC